MESLIELDRSLLLALNGSDSAFLDNFMWMVSMTWPWIPLAVAFLMLVVHNSSRRQALMLIGFFLLSILLADQVSSSIVKPLVARPRPTHDPVIAEMVDVVNGYRGGLYGFFSSHAANTFAIASFVTLTVRNRFLSISLYVWALLSSYSRIYLGVHFPGDILCGMLFGSFVGWACYAMYIHYATKGLPFVVIYNRRRWTFSHTLTRTGFRLAEVRIVASVFWITLAFIVIYAICA